MLAAPGIGGMTHRDPFILEQLGHLAEAAANADLDAALECVLRMWVDGPHRAPADVDPGVRKLCRELLADTVTRHGQTGHTLMTELNAIERAGELRAPILLPIGELDSVDIHDIVDLVAAAAPDARRVVLPGVGHNVNLERPDEFNQLVLEFLAQRSRT